MAAQSTASPAKTPMAGRENETARRLRWNFTPPAARTISQPPRCIGRAAAVQRRRPGPEPGDSAAFTAVCGEPAHFDGRIRMGTSVDNVVAGARHGV